MKTEEIIAEIQKLPLNKKLYLIIEFTNLDFENFYEAR